MHLSLATLLLSASVALSFPGPSPSQPWDVTSAVEPNVARGLFETDKIKCTRKTLNDPLRCKGPLERLAIQRTADCWPGATKIKCKLSQGGWTCKVKGPSMKEKGMRIADLGPEYTKRQYAYDGQVEHSDDENLVSVAQTNDQIPLVSRATTSLLDGIENDLRASMDLPVGKVKCKYEDGQSNCKGYAYDHSTEVIIPSDIAAQIPWSDLTKAKCHLGYYSHMWDCKFKGHNFEREFSIPASSDDIHPALIARSGQDNSAILGQWLKGFFSFGHHGKADNEVRCQKAGNQATCDVHDASQRPVAVNLPSHIANQVPWGSLKKAKCDLNRFTNAYDCKFKGENDFKLKDSFPAISQNAHELFGTPSWAHTISRQTLVAVPMVPFQTVHPLTPASRTTAKPSQMMTTSSKETSMAMTTSKATTTVVNTDHDEIVTYTKHDPKHDATYIVEIVTSSVLQSSPPASAIVRYTTGTSAPAALKTKHASNQQSGTVCLRSGPSGLSFYDCTREANTVNQPLLHNVDVFCQAGLTNCTTHHDLAMPAMKAFRMYWWVPSAYVSLSNAYQL